jgi:hypothetical protein
MEEERDSEPGEMVDVNKRFFSSLVGRLLGGERGGRMGWTAWPDGAAGGPFDSHVWCREREWRELPRKS